MEQNDLSHSSASLEGPSADALDNPFTGMTQPGRLVETGVLDQGSLLDQKPLDASLDEVPPEPKSWLYRNRLFGISLIVIGIIAAALLGVRLELNKSKAQQASLAPSSKLQQQTVPLSDLSKQLAHASTIGDSGVTVNGSLVLTPTAKPANPVAGQLFYNGSANQVQYYDGNGFVSLQGGGNVTNTTNVYNTTAGNTYVNNTGTEIHGTSGKLAVFSGEGNNVGDSLISQSGSVISLGNTGGVPTSVTLQGAAAVGSNLTGGNLTIAPSNGTGLATSGNIIFQTGVSAENGIELDAANMTTANHGGPSPMTMSFTVGTHENQILIVSSTYIATNSVSYDGISLTKLSSTTGGGHYGLGVYADLWYLVNPPTGTHQISIDITPIPGYSNSSIGAMSFYNVDQGSPFGTVVDASGSGNGSEVLLSVPTSNSSQIVVDTLATNDTFTCSTTNSGQNIGWSLAQSYFLTGCGSYTAAQDGLTDLSYYVPSTTDWIDIAVPLNPATPDTTPLAVPDPTTPDRIKTRLTITASGNVNISSNTIIQPADSRNALQVNDQTGNIEFNVDTVGNTISLGGATTVKPQADSASAFQIQNSVGTALLTANTTDMKISVGGDLAVGGSITVGGHIITGGDTPSIAAGTAATLCGSGGSPAVTILGNDTSGTVTVTTGSGGACTSGVLAAITFANSFGSTPHVILTPSSLASLNLGIYANSSTMTGFSISTGNSPAPTTTYTWDYWVAQ